MCFYLRLQISSLFSSFKIYLFSLFKYLFTFFSVFSNPFLLLGVFIFGGGKYKMINRKLLRFFFSCLFFRLGKYKKNSFHKLNTQICSIEFYNIDSYTNDKHSEALLNPDRWAEGYFSFFFWFDKILIQNFCENIFKLTARFVPLIKEKTGDKTNHKI